MPAVTCWISVSNVRRPAMYEQNWSFFLKTLSYIPASGKILSDMQYLLKHKVRTSHPTLGDHCCNKDGPQLRLRSSELWMERFADIDGVSLLQHHHRAFKIMCTRSPRHQNAASGLGQSIVTLHLPSMHRP
jgi:hypothetical protein